MLTRDDIVDIFIAGLSRPAAAARPKARLAPIVGRMFLSEYEIKKRLTPGGKRLTLAKDAILSPLALEWLTLKGIEIRYE